MTSKDFPQYNVESARNLKMNATSLKFGVENS